MPTALDRLLARPSALRALRSIVNAPELPTTCLPAVNCCLSTASRREHSSAAKSSTPPSQRTRRKRPDRAKVFRVHDFDRKSNLAQTNRPGSKGGWFDHVEEPDKTARWVQALQYRARVYGFDGIREIWFDMARCGYNLPTSDTADAAFLWTTLLKHPQLVLLILDHAAHLHKDTGEAFPRLYETCMVHWLPRHPKKALEYHHRIVLKLGLRTLPLRQLAQLLKLRFTSNSLEAFMDIYRTSNERDVYDEIVPLLCDKGEITDARRWHTLCFHRGDLPSPPVASHPLIQLFSAESSIISTPNKRFVYPSAAAVPRAGTPRYNEELMHRLLGRDTAPVRFEDSFCARMFATRAFPPESIIKGLSMAGVNEIGPLALRAMCTRTVPLSELPERFKELKEAGIALQACVFSLALEKFAMDGKFGLVRSILESDQHPDVFGNVELQTKLLDFYLGHEDWVQAHRTLAILTLFHNDPNTEAWNLLLQTHVRHFNPDRIFKVVQDMRANSILFTKESMQSIKSVLRRRQAGRKPGESTRGRFDDLRFVTRIYITILEAGLAHVPPLAWRELLRRHGMLGRFRELRRLVFWLLSWYAPRNGTKFANLPKSTFLDPATEKLRVAFPGWQQDSHLLPRVTQDNPFHPIRELFPNAFQQALIVWGFRAGLLPNASLEQSMLPVPASKKHYRQKFLRKGVLKRVDWSIGLRTLVELRDSGVHVHRHTVVKALQMQFVILFGRGRSLRKENRVIEDVNTIPYVEYVREVNRIWGSPLFREPQLFGTSRLHGLMWHPRLGRRVKRRTWLKIGEVLGDGRRRIGADTERDADQGEAVSNTDLGVDQLKRTFGAQGRAFHATSVFPTHTPILEAASSSSASGIDDLELASLKHAKRG